MKLLMAIIEDELAFKVAKALSEKGYRSTKLSSSGGFLKRGNTTLLIGVEDEQVDEVVEIIRVVVAEHPEDHEPDANEFAANIFVLPINDYVHM